MFYFSDDGNYDAICFKESLDIYCKKNESHTTEPIGNYSAYVDKFGGANNKFLICVHSSLNIDGSCRGFKVISLADKHLHCLEEKRMELLKLPTPLIIIYKKLLR